MQVITIAYTVIIHAVAVTAFVKKTIKWIPSEFPKPDNALVAQKYDSTKKTLLNPINFIRLFLKIRIPYTFFDKKTAPARITALKNSAQ